LGGILNVYLSKPYRHLTPKWRGTPPPEHRLYGAMFAGPSLAIGLFWIGWTGAFAAVPWCALTSVTLRTDPIRCAGAGDHPAGLLLLPDLPLVLALPHRRVNVL